MNKVVTDGSSRGNPGPGGWGAVVITDDAIEELGGREDKTTNNRMELVAVIEALRVIPEGEDVQVFSDSAYVIGGAKDWMKDWKRNGWRTRSGGDVANKDLWERLDLHLARVEAVFVKLPGHSGVLLNERADRIATEYADKISVSLYSGSYDDYPLVRGLVELEPGRGGEMKPKTGKAHSYISLVDGVFERHTTWPECKARVNGKKDVKFRKALSAEHEREIMDAWGVKEK